MRFIIPWPPSQLSPNARLHWAKKVAIKNNYILACKGIAAKAVGKIDTTGNVPIKITFNPPSKRGDLDNMLASIKSGIDGIAMALGVNDKQFRPITIDAGEPDKNNPHIEICLEIPNQQC